MLRVINDKTSARLLLQTTYACAKQSLNAISNSTETTTLVTPDHIHTLAERSRLFLRGIWEEIGRQK